MNWELFTAFLLITLVLFLTPGPAVTLVLATGASHGIRAGLITVLGITLGNALLLAAIALGLSWVLKNALALFEILRWLGAAYLLWLGIQAWRNAGALASAPDLRGRVHFRRGFTVAITNPKTIAFFTAFLPQFVDPSLPADRQLVLMCAISVLMGLATDSGFAVAAGFGRGYFLQAARAKFLGRLSAAALIGGSIWLTLARRPG
ncbi:MAG TPA: LysE family translocator [Xanthobacteraceae bacterium]|nr:LysE family translocator [Xanthobacteraceae bacterium]